MYCHDCGTDNTVDSKYCKECGARLNDGYRAMMQSVQDPLQDQSDEDTDALTRLLDMAFWHNQAGNIDAAITASEAALALSPHSTTAQSLLGTLYEKKGDDAEAIRHFEAVLARNPDSAADAAKLDQLRRGVHVKAVAPPVAHQWLPPALLKFAAQARQRTKTASAGNVSFPAMTGLVFWERIDPQRRPFYLAGVVTSAAFVGLLLLIHPWAQAETVKTYPIAAPTPTAVNRSAYAAPTAPPAALTPMVLLPPSNSSSRPSSAVPILSANDPFAGHVPTSPPGGTWGNGNSTDLSPWSLPPVRSRSASQNRRVAGRDLPPLRLSALPADNSGEILPAPVSLPEGLTATSALAASVPQHTVMVSSLTNGSSSSDNSPQTNGPQTNGPQTNGPQADPASHIHITVHQVRDGSTPPANTSSGGSIGGGAASDADAAQQRALTLQQSGDYRQARQAYQSAIRAYQSQIAAGQDVETAQRGLAACQTGLQICQQSQ